jgi:hypothetical protein
MINQASAHKEKNNYNMNIHEPVLHDSQTIGNIIAKIKSKDQQLIIGRIK